MDGDSSDILGGPTFPNARDSQRGRWSGLSFGVKSAFAIAILLVLYVVVIRAWETFLVWREKAYKLSMRRRHGIPDNDHRPFNVAYAAVVRARQESEAAARRAKLQEMVQDQQNALPDQNVRQRHGFQRNTPTPRPTTIPGRYESADILPSASTSTNYPYASLTTHSDAEERYHPNPVVRIAEPEVDNSPPRPGPSRRPIRKYVTVSDDEGRKRGFDGDESDGPDHAKKTRVEGEEFIGGDEEPEWHERYQVPQRGAKRVLGEEDDNEDAYQSTRTRDKRQRKFSLEKTPQNVAEDMDIDEDDDELAELRSTTRGKKRDRAEAGSTFGGDDDDSAHEAEAEDDSKRRRHRKRRTYAKRKSDAGMLSRGQKRDRDLAEGDSDAEYDDGMALKVSRKKRGKRSVSSEQDDRSDVSMDESQASSSRGRPRRIGDEWESNGVKYKIGPNGQRLRQTLVKKERQKFNMPKDSQHPDRQANLEVYIETWLTEEEYREAKDQLLLAWQDSNKPSVEPETPSRESQELPPAAGKDLLWKSTSAASSAGSSTPRQITPPLGASQFKQKDRELYSHSIASNVGLRINPFQKQQVPSGKRIASAARVSSVFNGATTHPSSPVSSSPSLTDSTNGSPRHKMYSKWEKQDLEAKAMMKMREANRKKEEEKAQKLREEKEKAVALKKEQDTVAIPKTIPTITLTKPEEPKPAQAEIKPPTLSFGPPPAADASKKAAPAAAPGSLFNGTSVGAQPQQQSKVATSPSFSFPTQPQQPAKPSAFPSTNGVPGGLPSKPTNNIFGLKPDQQRQSKPTLSFGFPTSSTAASTNPPPASTTAPSSTTTQPSFSFGPLPSLSAKASQPAEKKDETPSSSTGGSLFSRIAPTSATSQQPPQTTPFPFPKPEAPKPTSLFGNLSSAANVPQTSSSQPAPAAAAATTTPKFNFGFSTKPASTAAPALATASSSSLSGALGNFESKPTESKADANPSPFSFNAPAPPASSESMNSNTPVAVGGATTTSKFSFGTPSSSTSAFGTSNPFAPKAPTATSTTAPATGTSPFIGFGDSSSSTSAFPTQTTTSSIIPAAGTSSATAPAQSAFGFGGVSTSPFGSSNAFGGGGASNPFGTTTKAGETSKFGFNATPSSTTPSAAGGGSANIFAAKTSDAPNAFGFGAPSTPSSTTPAAGTNGENANKPLFSFGTPSTTPASSSTTAPAPGSSVFGSVGFGDAGKNSTTPQASQPGAGQSVFGKPSTGPSPFGFGTTGATNGSTTNTFSAFGKAPASTGQQQQ